MFVGHQATSLDDKNRICLPAKMRKKVEAASPTREVRLVPWLDGCMAIYMPNDWQRMAEKIQSNPYELAESRSIWRSVFPYVEEASFDRQWRLVFPKNLLGRAGIQRELVIAGMFDHLEIWSPEGWQQLEKHRALEENIKKTFDMTHGTQGKS